MHPQMDYLRAYNLKGDLLPFSVMLQICILTASCSMHGSEVGLAHIGYSAD